jgi:hypothetical protein
MSHVTDATFNNAIIHRSRLLCTLLHAPGDSTHRFRISNDPSVAHAGSLVMMCSGEIGVPHHQGGLVRF